MTQPFTSPFTGRPVIEWIDSELALHDSEGSDVGNVVEINPDFVVTYANAGFLGLGEPRVYFIPREFIGRIENDDWYLTVDKDQLEAMGWRAAPNTSPWSDDWSEGEMAYDLHPWRGQTRVRRYEESTLSA
jgi:hypothetical protein